MPTCMITDFPYYAAFKMNLTEISYNWSFLSTTNLKIWQYITKYYVDIDIGGGEILLMLALSTWFLMHWVDYQFSQQVWCPWEILNICN